MRRFLVDVGLAVLAAAAGALLALERARLWDAGPALVTALVVLTALLAVATTAVQAVRRWRAERRAARRDVLDDLLQAVLWSVVDATGLDPRDLAVAAYRRHRSSWPGGAGRGRAGGGAPGGRRGAGAARPPPDPPPRNSPPPVNLRDVPSLPTTREKLLDAFSELLVTAGVRAATLDAVAAAAGVSKGGLLYHFGTKDALVEGLLERFRALAAEDVRGMRAAPGGAVDYYLRTSAVQQDDPLSRTGVAVLHLAQVGDARAAAVFAAATEDWRAAIEEEVGDRVLSRVVQLVGDGLWAGSSIGEVPADVDDVVAATTRLLDAARRR
ncbi:TetR/AcrR family transcriptional regulator [Kineococcus gypseus]|uniref:TetR/AcrR family transcriptional regulator n=1 Tax=Kineococcus gypseus TaxID=1637102 RepID=UPI003D7D6645